VRGIKKTVRRQTSHKLYNLTARIFPMLLFYLPLPILAVIFSIEIDKKVQMLSSFGVVAALSYFNAHP
jgi:hypothetical protein